MFSAAPVEIMHDTRVRITYDADADAAYIYMTDRELMPGRDSVPVNPPEGVQVMVILDWKDGKIAGLEVLDAAALLHPDLLAQAVRPGHVQGPARRRFLRLPCSSARPGTRHSGQDPRPSSRHERAVGLTGVWHDAAMAAEDRRRVIAVLRQ